MTAEVSAGAEFSGVLSEEFPEQAQRLSITAAVIMLNILFLINIQPFIVLYIYNIRIYNESQAEYLYKPQHVYLCAA